MTLKRLFKTHSFDRTIVFGYYGGGNYGDELLLTILIGLLHQHNYKDLHYAYMDKNMHTLLAHDYPAQPHFGYRSIFAGLMQSKNIIVGGGGHWGLDANPTVLLMSIMLWLMRYIGRKNVYLVGVGYYTSTNKLGDISAYIAGKSANRILARDPESYDQFRRITRKVSLDEDIAFNLDPNALTELDSIDTQLSLTRDRPYVFVALRRFRGDKGQQYTEALETTIQTHPETTFVLMLLEPASTNQEGTELMQHLTNSYSNALSYDFHHNPLELAALFQRHAHNSKLIAPQYHAQLTAHIVGMDFFPVSYDNKVGQLLQRIGKTPVAIEDTDSDELRQFIGVADA